MMLNNCKNSCWGSGSGQQLLSAEKSHFATHVDITVNMIVEFQNIKANQVRKIEKKLIAYASASAGLPISSFSVNNITEN